MFNSVAKVDVSKVSDERNEEIEEIIRGQIDGERSIAGVVAFDFTFYDEDGNVVEPEEGTVSVSVRLSDDMQNTVNQADLPVIQVFHIDEENTAEEVESETVDERVSFEAEKFTEYGVVLTDGDALVGECGEKVTWRLTTDGTLTISGEGAMEATPWRNYKSNIKKLVVEEGVTTIADEAFDGCRSLETISLPNTLEIIGSSAFSGSALVGDLIIPDGVKEIGEYAFSSCSELTGKLVIPNGLEKIEYGTFENCSNLTGNLIIPDSIKYIGIDAFYGCGGFDGSLQLSVNLEEIEREAFVYCSGFSGSLQLPANIKSIGDMAFYGCRGFGGDLNVPEGVTSIGELAFGYCTGLTGTVTIPAGVSGINTQALNGCTEITKVVNYSGQQLHLPTSSQDKWVNNDNPQFQMDGITYGIAVRMCNFTFMVDDEVVAEKTVKVGDYITKPDNPTKEGKAFDGWYTNDKEYSWSSNNYVLFDFSQPVTHGEILYGMWVGGAQTPTGSTHAATTKASTINADKTVSGSGSSSTKATTTAVAPTKAPNSTTAATKTVAESTGATTKGTTAVNSSTQNTAVNNSQQFTTSTANNTTERATTAGNTGTTQTTSNSATSAGNDTVEPTAAVDSANRGTTANDNVIKSTVKVSSVSNSTALNNNITATTTSAEIEVATGSSIEVIENTIKAALVGTTVTVDMSEDKTVSKDILEAAKGKDVDVVLDMGDYTWTINGTQITGNELKDVDLTVSFETTNIPEDKLSFMVGDNQYKTISLEYSGQFGFVGSLGFNVGKENVGKYVNLYYYTPAGYLEYQGSGVVDARGDTTLVFTHASDYIAVLADAEPTSSETVSSPITSDKVNILPFVVMMCMAAMIFFACEASKRDAERQKR